MKAMPPVPRPPGIADLYVGSRQVAWQGPGEDLHLHTAAGLDEAMAWLASELAASPTRLGKLRVWLGASTCRLVQLRTTTAALSAGERVQVEEAAAASQSGLQPPLRIWFDEADPAGGRLAVVVEQRLLDRLDQLARTTSARLVSVKPWWSEVLRQVVSDRPDLQGLAVWDGEALTQLVGAGDGFCVARTTIALRDAQAAQAASVRTLMAEGVDRTLSLTLGLAMRPGVPPSGARDHPPTLDALPFGAWATRLESWP